MRNLFILAVWALVSFFYSSVVWSLPTGFMGAEPEELTWEETKARNCEIELLKLKDALEENKFAIHRNFSDYDARLGEGKWLKPTLLGITRPFHWLDGGSGYALAQLQALNLVKPKLGPVLPHEQRQFLRATAVTHTRPPSYEADPKVDKLLDSPPSNFKYLCGDILKILEKMKSGSVDLITDLFGAMSYTNDITSLLKLYLRLLKVGGDLLLYLDVETKVEYEGKMQPFVNVICKILPAEYFSCEYNEPFYAYFNRSNVVRIRKLKQSDLSFIPNWQFDEKAYKFSTPPIRAFTGSGVRDPSHPKDALKLHK